MKISVLAENTAEPGFLSEHGLSLLIEAAGEKILFDAGQTGLFEENAHRLGAELSDVTLCILSHGHYDHGGGLKRFLEINSIAPVYISRYAFGEYYNASDKYIGLDSSLMENRRVVLTDDTTQLRKGLTLYAGDIQGQDGSAAGLTMKCGGRLIPDTFRHEQYLLIEDLGRRILISGCSHRGIVSIEERFRPDILVGGFHLMKMSLGDELAGTAAILDSYSTDYYTCHCTGQEQYAFLKKTMNRLHYIRAGQIIDI